MLYKHLAKIKKNVSDNIIVNADLGSDKSDELWKNCNVFNLPLTSEEELCLFEEQLLNNKIAKDKMVRFLIFPC